MLGAVRVLVLDEAVRREHFLAASLVGEPGVGHGTARPLDRVLVLEDLSLEVAEDRFREDLYYRLNVINIRVPGLRERREDIPLLVDHLIRRHNAEMKRTYKGAGNAALKILMSLRWKGNVRELDNVIERAMILGNGEWITPAELPQWEAPKDEPNLSAGNNLRIAVQSYEKSHIENVLKETAGDKTRAARLLGVSRSSLYRKLESLDIHAED